jgi:linker between RRM2 and RRM3 domains in RBM39 protein
LKLFLGDLDNSIMHFEGLRNNGEGRREESQREGRRQEYRRTSDRRGRREEHYSTFDRDGRGEERYRISDREGRREEHHKIEKTKNGQKAISGKSDGREAGEEAISKNNGDGTLSKISRTTLMKKLMREDEYLDTAASSSVESTKPTKTAKPSRCILLGNMFNPEE